MDLDKFADLLDIAIINLKETDQTHELGNGSLNINLQRKLPGAMLARYHRWIFENCKQESVLTLRSWVIQEAEFQTTASETVHGLSGKVVTETIELTGAKNKYQRTFIGDAKGNRDVKKLLCKVFGSSHEAWTRAKFMNLSLPDRRDTAKELPLCFRCLGDNHPVQKADTVARTGVKSCTTNCCTNQNLQNY